MGGAIQDVARNVALFFWRTKSHRAKKKDELRLIKTRQYTVVVPCTLHFFAGGPGVDCGSGKQTLQRPKARDGGERRMGAVTPGETLGTLYNIHVGSNGVELCVCV